MSVVVFGSINMDLVVRTPRLPAPGETLAGETFFTAPGGKGANQAVACARLGVPTRMVGRVGDDVFGGALRESLQQNGVDISGVVTDPPHSSGVAVIAVDASAENSIIIVPGANGQVGADDIARLDPVLGDARVLLLQLEVPLDAVVAAARAARRRGVIVILDPAPARPLPTELYSMVDILTPNETEAAALTGLPLDTDEEVRMAAGILLGRGVRQVIIKLGERGAYARSADQAEGRFHAAFKVDTIDTVAAGDAFNGVLAAALAEGRSFDEAVRWGMVAGALSTTRHGAQPSMPTREEVMQLLNPLTKTGAIL